MRKYFAAVLIILLISACVPAQQSGHTLQNLIEITANNAHLVKQVARYGDGELFEAVWSHDQRYVAFPGSIGIWLYEIATTSLHLLEGHASRVTDTVFHPNGSLLVSSSFDGTVRVWDIQTGEQRVIADQLGPIEDLDLSRDGKLVAVVSWNNSLMIANLFSGEAIFTYTHDSPVLSVSFLSDNRSVAFGDYAGQLFLLDLQTQTINQLGVIETLIAEMHYLPDEDVLILNPGTPTEARWSFAENTIQAAHVTQHAPFTGEWTYPNQDETLEVIVNSEGFILIDAASEEPLAVQPLNLGWQSDHLAVSSDGRYAAIDKRPHGLMVWDLQTSSILTTLPTRYSTENMVWQPHSQWLAYISREGRSPVLLWNPVTDERRLIAEMNSIPAEALAFDPDGDVLAFHRQGDSGWELVGWNVEAGEQQFQFPKNGYRVIAFSPDARWLAYDDGYDIVIRDVEQQAEHVRIADTDDFPEPLVFSPDSTYITAGINNTIAIWNVTTGEQRQISWGERLEGEPLIASLSFNSDGTLIAAGSRDVTYQDNNIRIWDFASGQQLTTLFGHTEAVVGAVFTSDDKLLVSASEDGTIRLWGIETQPPDSRLPVLLFVGLGILLAMAALALRDPEEKT
jgi:WD40 repeat protein